MMPSPFDDRTDQAIDTPDPIHTPDPPEGHPSEASRIEPASPGPQPVPAETFAVIGSAGPDRPGTVRRILADASQSLTRYEIEGLEGPLSLADGHAAQNPSETLQQTIDSLPGIWNKASKLGVVGAAHQFISSWALLANEPEAPRTLYLLSGSASANIDYVAAAIRDRGKRMSLIEPTFDNIGRLASRRGVHPWPLPEWFLHEDPVRVVRMLGCDDVLFLVDPNNPTGASLNPTTLDLIMAECADRGVALVIDRTFRCYATAPDRDLLGRLKRSGVSYVLIEDTGKTWPTHEMKVSAMFLSEDWRPSLHAVFEEVFLAHSSVVMLFFAELFAAELADGFPGPLHSLVQERRQRLRQVLGEGPLKVASESLDSRLPVEWIDIGATGRTDLQLVDHLAARTGVHILPGRQFYWSNMSRSPTDRVRVSLLKRQDIFDDSLRRLDALLREER